MKYLGTILMLFLVASCGFQPVHSKRFEESLAVNLSAILIETDNTRIGQLLNAEINDQVNPASKSSPKQYQINIAISESELSQFINTDGTSSRGDLQYYSNYEVTRLSDGKAVDSGSFQRISSYNTSQNADYASFVSREDARKRAITELARDYKLRLANLLPKLNDPNAAAAKPVEPEAALPLPSLQRYETQPPRN